MQITIASSHQGQNVGLSNPWTEYCKLLPSVVPVPTMWMEEERDLLFMGTSLEVSKVLTLHINLLRLFILYAPGMCLNFSDD